MYKPENGPNMLPEAESVPVESAGHSKLREVLTKVAVGSSTVVALVGLWKLDLSPDERTLLTRTSDIELANKRTTDLEPPFPNPQIQGRYRSASVDIHSRLETEHSTFSCRGTSIGGNRVLTAAHCIIDEDERGHIVTADPKEGIDVIDAYGSQRFADSELHWPNFEEDREGLDLAVLSVRGINSSIPLAETNPNYGDPVYLLPPSEDEQATMNRGVVIAPPAEGKPMTDAMFEIDSPENDVCPPGTSGSGVINKAGELTGVVSRPHEPFELTDGLPAQYGLSDSEAGKDVVFCSLVPVSQAQKLVYE